jgi:hypothetical protein
MGVLKGDLVEESAEFPAEYRHHLHEDVCKLCVIKCVWLPCREDAETRRLSGLVGRLSGVDCLVSLL